MSKLEQNEIKPNQCPYCGASYTLKAGGCEALCKDSERVKLWIREAIEEDERHEPRRTPI